MYTQFIIQYHRIPSNINNRKTRSSAAKDGRARSQFSHRFNIPPYNQSNRFLMLKCPIWISVKSYYGIHIHKEPMSLRNTQWCREVIQDYLQSYFFTPTWAEAHCHYCHPLKGTSDHKHSTKPHYTRSLKTATLYQLVVLENVFTDHWQEITMLTQCSNTCEMTSFMKTKQLKIKEKHRCFRQGLTTGLWTQSR